jgi:hypothetical protein
MREPSKSGSRFGRALRLGVSHDALALVETRRWGREAEVLAECRLDGTHAFAAALAAGMNTLFEGVGRERWPLSVVLADDLARLWQVTPPAGCARMADLEAAAALRFQQLYGEPAASWQLSADWHLGRPFLAAALPQSLLGALQQAVGARAVPLIDVAPQCVTLFNRWRASLAGGDWFGVVHDGVLTVGACEQGGLSSVRAVAIGGHADGTWLREHLDREALRLNVSAPARLRLCGSVPPAWSALADCVVLGTPPAGWSPAAILAASGSEA